MKTLQQPRSLTLIAVVSLPALLAHFVTVCVTLVATQLIVSLYTHLSTAWPVECRVTFNLILKLDGCW